MILALHQQPMDTTDNDIIEDHQITTTPVNEFTSDTLPISNYLSRRARRRRIQSLLVNPQRR